MKCHAEHCMLDNGDCGIKGGCASDLIPRIFKDALPELRLQCKAIEAKEVLAHGYTIHHYDWEVQKEAFSILAWSIDNQITTRGYTEEQTFEYYKYLRSHKS